MYNKRYICLLVLLGITIVALSVAIAPSLDRNRRSVIMYDSIQQMCDSIQRQNDTLINLLGRMEALSYIRNYVLFTIDTNAYEMMVKDSPEQRHLAYSIYMADQCSYPRACYQVYEEISETIDELENMELRHKATQMAVRYLKKGAKLKDQQCTFVLAQMYIKGDHVSQDSVLGRKYLEQVVAPELVESEYNDIKRSKEKVFLPSNIGRYVLR